MRKEIKALIEFFDKKLKENGMAQDAIKRKDVRALTVEAAKVCVGIKEKTGKNDGPMVELFQAVGGGRKGHSWCMYFQQALLMYAEYKTGVKSKLPNGGHCTTIWKKVKKSNPDLVVNHTPLPGAWMIFQHGNGPSGHVELVLAADEKYAHCIGGNTSGSTKGGGVDRNGNGVYYTKRLRKGTKSMKVLGFIKPL